MWEFGSIPNTYTIHASGQMTQRSNLILFWNNLIVLCPSFPFIPIDGISFHSKENVQHWKYVLQCRIADEKVMSDQTTACLDIMELIHHCRLWMWIPSTLSLWGKWLWIFRLVSMIPIVLISTKFIFVLSALIFLCLLLTHFRGMSILLLLVKLIPLPKILFLNLLVVLKGIGLHQVNCLLRP